MEASSSEHLTYVAISLSAFAFTCTLALATALTLYACRKEICNIFHKTPDEANALDSTAASDSYYKLAGQVEMMTVRIDGGADV